MSTQPARHAGYTIIETLIFLAVTSALLMAVFATVGSQQRQSDFNQGIREVEGRLQDILNNVSTGYYNRNIPFNCNATAPGRPAISAPSGAANAQGTNAGCLFIGQVIQFKPSGNANSYITYTVVGRQKTSGASARDVSSFSEAFPTAIAPGTGPAGPPDTSVAADLPAGITLEKMCYSTTSCVTGESNSFGIFSGFGTVSGAGAALGSSGYNILPIPGTPTRSQRDMVDAINAISDTNNADLNPTNGVILCFKSGGTNQYGKITVGGGNRQESLRLEIVEGTCQ